jgi:hypothetical protein
MDPYDELDAREKLYQRIGSAAAKKNKEDEKKRIRAMAKADREAYKVQAKMHFSPNSSEKPKAPTPKAPSSSQTSVRKAPTLLKSPDKLKNVGGPSRGFMVAINKWKDLFS